jgi:PAS domain S-box-containing protein
VDLTATLRGVPHYICPKCKQRSVDVDAREGFSSDAPACRHCGFGFLFELMEDYYPGPNTGLVVCDQQGRVLAVGKGVFELSGYRDADLIGRDVQEIVEADPNPVAVALEWGVRRLGQRVGLKTRAGMVKAVIADLFPALDADGGLLVALSPEL